jgi:hypothetical protein
MAEKWYLPAYLVRHSAKWVKLMVDAGTPERRMRVMLTGGTSRYLVELHYDFIILSGNENPKPNELFNIVTYRELAELTIPSLT